MNMDCINCGSPTEITNCDMCGGCDECCVCKPKKIK